jgi:ketosteroid isomerase-like protein
MLKTLLLMLALAAPEDEIRGVLARQQADWNRADVESFMTGYDNSEQTTFQGKALSRGYGSVLERYRKSYPNAEAMGQLKFSEIEVRMLGADAALVLGRFSLERSPAAGGPATGRFTLIFRKTAQGWKIIHDHTS